jgi:hypothetical protein
MEQDNGGANALSEAKSIGPTPEEHGWGVPEGQEQPAPAPAEAEPAAPKAETPNEADDGDDDEPAPGTPRWARRELKRRAEEARQLRAEMAELRQQMTRQTPQQPAPAAPKFDPSPWIGAAPKPEDYAAGVYDPSYVEDRAAWRVKGEMVQHALTQQQQRAQAEQASTMRAFRARETEFAETAPDYEMVARNPSLPITPTMAEAIAESDAGPAVAYFLGRNPKEAERISGLSPRRQAIEIGRIEARLERDAEKPKSPTNAPPPVPQVRARSAAPTRSLADMVNLPIDDFAAAYRKQTAGR